MKKKKIKKSPFTLAQTWEYCVAMWKWIAKNHVEGVDDVEDLKRQWLKENGFELMYTSSDCFFCDYSDWQGSICSESCPGAMVDPKFYCTYPTYSYDTEPKKFYHKLLRMNRKWMRNKGGK